MVKKSYLLRASHCNAVLAKGCRGGDINARQRGSVSLMFVFAMLVIIGVFALALELPQIYNRKVEMQNLADAVALSAARELDGTAAGISNAINEAKNTADMFSYAYNTKDVRSIWSASALTFGVSRSSDNWKSEGAAKGAPEGLFFVKVDTRDLSAGPGVLGSFVFAPASNTFDVPGRALAGRSTINAMPLAICAMANDPGVSRSGELVEYGFRRGVSYDLMQLNPGGTTALNFLINPVAVPGAAGSSAGTATDIVAPFVCTGSMAMPRVKGGAITVQKDFPLDQYFSQINSRFDTLVSPCSAVTAPPDANVKSYVFNNGSVPWMSAMPDGQTAQTTIAGGKLWTVADDSPATGTAGMYGPLWVYAKAAKFASYTPGLPEPASGYTPFTTGDWNVLYNPGQPGATGYPGSGKKPYDATSAPNYRAPPSGRRGLRNRRVLNIPLLECSAAGATAGNVLAIGKFFMTVPATATQLVAEFAGVASEGSLGGQVELYQ